ncbi:hypothetical protein [Planktothrix pseudagardhii]|nr:hypothetical protein [Planktothrix pseudagardhii]
MNEASLANLTIAARQSANGEARTVHASARLTPSGKKELQQKLKELKMNLAEFLEAFAVGEIEVVKSGENQQKIVAKIK